MSFLLRLNNPGALKHVDENKWLGLVPHPAATPERERKYARFESLPHGIRAAARILLKYRSRGWATVHQIISHWSPVGENSPAQTNNYIDVVEDRLGIADPTTPVNVLEWDSMVNILNAMFDWETGGTWSSIHERKRRKAMEKGLTLAGLTKPRKSLLASRTLAGGAMAGLGTLGETFTETGQQLSPYMDHAAMALVVIGLVVVLWARVDDWRQGLR